MRINSPFVEKMSDHILLAYYAVRGHYKMIEIILCIVRFYQKYIFKFSRLVLLRRKITQTLKLTGYF